MDLQEILKHVIEEVYILVPVLYVLGRFLKNTPILKDWLIPYVLLAVGITLSTVATGDVYTGVTQGTLTAGGAVLVNELIKQTKKKE